MPALRERPEDIMVLADHFLKCAVEENEKAILGFTTEARLALLSYSWPGNVRELKNEIDRAVALSENGQALGADCFFDRMDATENYALRKNAQLKECVEALEKAMIRGALSQCVGNISQAATHLGLSRQGLQQKLKKYGI